LICAVGISLIFLAKLHDLLATLQIAHFIPCALLFPNNELEHLNAI